MTMLSWMFCGFAVIGGVCQAQTNLTYLTATAIMTNAQGHSVLRCWEFESPFNVSTTAGTSGAATFNFEVANATYTVIPPHFDGGAHNAPATQLVAFMSGLAHITLPVLDTHCRTTSCNEAYVTGGTRGLIVAVDTVGTGHITKYPLDVETISVQIPFKDGIIPDHRILNVGPCRYDDTSDQSSKPVASASGWT